VRIEVDAAERARTLSDRSEIAWSRNAAVAVLAELDSAIRGMPGDGAPPESLAFRALARAELTRLKAEVDPEPWIAAADRFRSLGELSRVAYVDLRMAEALAASGAPGSLVAERLRAAYAVAASLGLVMFAEQVQAAARVGQIELAEPPQRGAPDQADRGPLPRLGLADHELEVLASALPPGVTTLLFSDIEDSTLLLDRPGDEPFMRVLHQHNRVVREQIASHDGQEIKTAGDSFMVAFGQPRRALACAVAIQRAVVKIEPTIRVRIGLHAGEAIHHGDDLFGRHVVIAARVVLICLADTRRAYASGQTKAAVSLSRARRESSLTHAERRPRELRGRPPRAISGRRKLQRTATRRTSG
jgi:class 3 adenylate cyclase